MSRDVPGLSSFATSIAAYEAWMREALGGALVKRDLDAKHEALRKKDAAFVFLRGTCWRWAEAAPLLVPTLMDAPRVPSVGDAHAENFGIWYDADRRLVWGINDYDEAARLPWCLDLVRLCASIILALPDWRPGSIADHLLDGYKSGLRKPAPFVLERENLWLRDAFAAKDRKRVEFWKKIDGEKRAKTVPPALRKALLDGGPAPAAVPRITARQAGVGSLGRPRFVARYEYRGGPVAVEVKVRLPSCWGGEASLPARMANGRFRSPDPMLHYAEHHVLRRIAPNSRKLDLGEVPGIDLRGLMTAMGAELAAVHAETDTLADTVLANLARRKRRWLKEAAEHVAEWTADEQDMYRKR